MSSTNNIINTPFPLQIPKGGTGLTTFNGGDMTYYGSGNALSALGIGAAHTIMASSGSVPQWVGGTAASGNVLTYNGSAVVWSAPVTGGTVTSVAVSSSTGITVGGSPITSSGTITLALPGSGGSSAVVSGDLLLGGSGSYAALAISTSVNTGDCLTNNGSNSVAWEPRNQVLGYSWNNNNASMGPGTTSYAILNMTSTTLIYKLLRGTVTPPSTNAALIIKTNIHGHMSATDGGQINYWIGTDRVTGSQYNAACAVTFPNGTIVGTGATFALSVPVLISSIRNSSNTQLILMFQNTFSTANLVCDSFDTWVTIEYYPYGITA